MTPRPLPFAAAVLLVVAASAGRCEAGGKESSWRDDPVWYDGLAEKCVYEASRTVYGKSRSYLATAYTNKETVDEKSTVKSESNEGLLVFKHHWSERVPTENYDYDYSTMTYTRCDDLSPFKLTAATQEDCGASFKELWRERGALRWMESVYLPDAGRREGRVALEPDVVLADALTLTLRDFPFDDPEELDLRVIPTQRDTHHVSFEPQPRSVHYIGREELDLPIGKVAAHALELRAPDGAVVARYWFAADGSSPRLHALVKYEDAVGLSFRLKSLERTAYWKRPG